MKKSFVRIFTVVLAMTLCLCIPSSALALGDTLNWGVYSAPKGFFMSGIYDAMYDLYVLELTQDPLFLQDTKADEQVFRPRLAESWEVSEDGMEYVFHLRSDVKWHDGEPFTADDVIFDFTSFCDYRMNANNYLTMFSNIAGAPEYYEYTRALSEGTEPETVVEGVSGLEKIDDYTFKITLGTFYAPFMTSLSNLNIFAKHIWEDIPIDTWRTCDTLKTPMGTGPYKFVKYEQDQYVTFEANPDYYLGEPKIKNVVYKIVNQDTAQVELINGDLDVVSMISNPTKEVMDNYENNGMNVLEFADQGYQIMAINTQVEKLADNTVRQAFCYAINRQGMIDHLLNGHATLLNCPCYRDSWAYPDDLEEYAYNPEKAVELLNSIGWVDTDGDGVLDKDGEPFEVSLLCPTGNKVREQSAVIIQQNLKDIGVTCDVETMDFNTVMERASYSDNYELALIGWSVGIDPDVFSMYHSSTQFLNDNNMARYANLELDPLLEASAAEPNQEKRGELFYQIFHILNQDIPMMMLYSPNEIRASRPELVGYDCGNESEFINIQDWYFE
ncbi:MAG: ABC transporter substrate-binding protein [Clostridia bacterium]|nr:ABC transporter substrate-binding protein [Clostridia bacterium]